jgi:hypothetical protein
MVPSGLATPLNIMLLSAVSPSDAWATVTDYSAKGYVYDYFSSVSVVSGAAFAAGTQSANTPG